MTLNVIIQDMVAVDSEASLGNRTSDDSEKSDLFDRATYSGIIIGNGSSLYLHRAISWVRDDGSPQLDSFVKKLEEYMTTTGNQQYERHLKKIREKIELKFSTINDTEKREEHITQEFGQEVEKAYHNASTQEQGNLHVIAYDKTNRRVRKYMLGNRKGVEVVDLDLIPVYADGSGGDLAQAYLSTNTSGIEWDRIEPANTFYLTTLACAAATTNAGVGGFMRVARIQEKSEYLDREKVNVAVRICAKQIAGNISKKEAMQLVKTIFEGKADYQKIARKLDISYNDLMYSPTRLHQDVSKFNRMLQKNNGK